MSRWSERVAYFMAREKCVRCGKQDAYTMNHHKMCYECTIKARNYQNERNQPRLAEIKEKQKQRYQGLKEAGLCVSCGQREALGGMSMCKSCLIRSRTYVLKRKENQ